METEHSNRHDATLPQGKPRRRWFQFSLRTLLTVTTLAAIGLGVMVWRTEPQRRAVQAIRSFDGGVKYQTDVQLSSYFRAPQWLQTAMGEDYFSAVEEVGLEEAPISDADLANLEGLTSLKLVNLENTSIGDEGLTHLRELQSLKWLFLDRTKVSDAGIEHLIGLPHLIQLSVRHTQISEAGLDKLKAAFPNSQIDY